MKIIGETKDGKIVEISNNEVANLIGFYSDYSGEKSRPKVGDEIKVNAMFMQLYKIKGIKGQVKTIADSCNELLEAIRTKSPVIESIGAEIEKSEPAEK